jgi:2-polyprenyl-3-methyl-5-hydroxy-6-metoxy-1,4-benzoquinol methylase
MTYEQDYFSSRKYHDKAELVRRHVLSVLGWASKAAGTDLLDGQGKRALDIGCAYGYTSHALSQLGYQTVGTDISTWGIKQAKTQGGGDFLVCDAQTNLPFKPETFDLVACFDVLEHLSYPERALAALFEASKGAVVCTTPNRKVEKPIRTLTRDYDPTHISTKTPADWKACFQKNLAPGVLRVEAFYDLAFKFGGKLIYKSFSVPTYGLTVRIVVKK